MAKGDANFGAAGKKGYMGGMYSRKAMNLTKKELGKSGVAAARKRTVDISQTSRADGKTLGPGGKPLTGRVKMGNGNIAVYKAGKRVIAQKAAKPTASAPSKERTPTPAREMSAAAKAAKKARTGRRVVDTAGRAGMAMAREKSGTSTKPSGAKSAMDKWKSLSPEQRSNARKSATKFAQMMGINPTKSVLGSLGVKLNPGPAPRNPLSVKGSAERIGSSYSMTAAQARAIIAASNDKNKRVAKTLLDAARKVIEGR